MRISVVVLAACLFLTACGAQTAASTNSIQSTEDVVSSQPSDFGNDEAIETAQGYLKMLDCLIGLNWEKTSDIPVYNLTDWYGRQLDSEERQKYRIDGRDGLFFPEDEFETAMEKYFGLTADYLRNFGEGYSEEEHVYYIVAALGPLAPRTYEITDISENDSVVSIEFTVICEENGDKTDKLLKLTYTDDGVRFLSCVETSAE